MTIMQRVLRKRLAAGYDPVRGSRLLAGRIAARKKRAA